MSVGLYPVGTVAVALVAVASGGSPDVTVSISGVSASASVGSLVSGVSVAASGVSGAGSVGTVTASAGGPVSVSITGVSASGSVGAVVSGVSYGTTGVSASGAVGSVKSALSVSLTSVSASGVAGTVTVSGGVTAVRQKGLRKTRYVPGRVPSSANELPRYLAQEQERLTDALESPFTHISLSVLHSEPLRKFDGMVVLADGTDWNPGSGEGIYAYYGGSWKKLG